MRGGRIPRLPEINRHDTSTTQGVPTPPLSKPPLSPKAFNNVEDQRKHAKAQGKNLTLRAKSVPSCWVVIEVKPMNIEHAHNLPLTITALLYKTIKTLIRTNLVIDSKINSLLCMMNVYRRKK